MAKKITPKDISHFPDLFKFYTYKQVAERLHMKPTTLKNYVSKTPQYFTLGQIDAMAEFLQLPHWWLLRKVHDWCLEARETKTPGQKGK
jgi:hypothetical protein